VSRTWDSGLTRYPAGCATASLPEALSAPRVRHTIRVIQAQLFAAPTPWPEGFSYAPEFLNTAQEAQLLEVIRTLPFEEAQYKEWRARRRIVSFGGRYDFTHQQLSEAPPIPQFLQPLRIQLATWAEIPEERIQHAMIAEYRPSTPLGWHRDVPEFEDVLGVSLLGQARLRFRPWPPPRGQRATRKIDLEPRSAYLMRGAARWQWQHAVSPTPELRYSITFRTRNAQLRSR
jgi:alkylated DNA repair dioxygenase AlkB